MSEKGPNFNVMSTADARSAAKRDSEFLKGGATIDQEHGNIVLTDKQLEDVKREKPEGGRLPKGVVEIDGLNDADLMGMIRENKILVGTKDQVATALKKAGVVLPGRGIEEAGARDCWAFQVKSSDEKKSRYYQIRVIFLDSAQNVSAVDLATADGGFGGLYGAMEKAGLNNPVSTSGGGRLVEDKNFERVIKGLTTEI